jgi:microcystin-dependent protein
MLPFFPSDGMPVGSVIAFAGEVQPNPKEPPQTGMTCLWGWLVCDGSLYTTNEQPLLYQALGTRYNQKGDPNGQFRVPDYRGYFLRMVNGTGGVDPDTGQRWLPDGTPSSDVGSFQYCALQDHVHGYTIPDNAVQIAIGNDGTAPAVPGTGAAKTAPPDDIGQPPDTGHSPNETRPVNMYVYYLIKSF